MSRTHQRRPWFKPLILSSLAGLIYSSWPLGYWLNPRGSDGGLVSELGALNQPYSWLFVGLDVVSGLLIVCSVLLMWRWRLQRRRGWFRSMLALFALFGVFTAAAALLPLDCDPTASQLCLESAHNPLLIYHGLFSILSPLCLLAVVSLVWWHGRRQGNNVLMLILVGGFGLFGLLALLQVLLPNRGNDYLVQRYYVLLCSAWTAVLPYAIWRALQINREIAS